MKKEKISLIKLYLFKERVHYKRIKLGFLHFKGLLGKILGGGILAVLITISHYIFAFPHFIFECAMWVFVRGQFKMNMVNLYSDANKKLLMYNEREKRLRRK
jgi:hypothetical protein